MARVVALVALVVLPCVARADMPPPEGYVETCTVELQAGRGGGPCEAADQFQGSVDPAVDARLRARGLTPRCSSWGATVSTAVYCAGPESAAVAPTPTTTPTPTPTPAIAPTPPPPTPAASNCAASPSHRSTAALWLVIAGAWFVLRRALRPR